MATQARRAGSENTAAPVPFSYAMAAKGLSSGGSSTAAPSKPSSGSNTPAKESRSNSIPAPVASVASWADDAEAEHAISEKPSDDGEPQSQVEPQQNQAAAQPPAIASGVSSPDLGASSASTAVKEDDASSLQNAASESTWESKSQASTSVDKSSEPTENVSQKAEKTGKGKGKGKGKEADAVPPKPLLEAPIPTVNPWARRIEEQKAKVVPKPAAKAPAVAGQANGVSHSSSGLNNNKKNNDAREKVITEGRQRPRDQEKEGQPRKDARQEAELEKTKKSAKGRPYDKDARSALPLPPTRDQESWPTPESAVDEDRKKTQGKPEKVEKERKDTASSGKKEWVPVPYTPTVVFNTPLPSTATSRRGGRGGSRGGAQNNSRGAGFGANGTGPSDKEASLPSALANGDHPKRGRVDGANARDASPKERRAGSASSASQKDGKPVVPSADKGSKGIPSNEPHSHSRKESNLTESISGTAAPVQNNSFPRQYPSNRPGKGRRGDMLGGGDRRKDADLMFPNKDTVGAFDKRTSTATQTDALEDNDKRASAFQDGQPGQQKLGSNERRAYNSFSGRERGRGGGRGGRGGYQNGHHQFANGHVPPMQPTSTFPLARSPTNFQPDQNAYFPAPSGHGRNYRNGPRSQSVTNENMYGRGPYPGMAQQLPPIQTYSPAQMYDFMPPVSAMPFSPYGVDHWTLTAMVSTQMEYYFSVENLCKDIFLRKHMDSQGFVFLNVLAEFNRIKQLTTNTDIIKHVCHTSPTIEYRIGADGKDRLRRREGWEQWVLTKSERDASAQNDGPGELHNPPPPHFSGFEQPGLPRYGEVPLNGVGPVGTIEGSARDNGSNGNGMPKNKGEPQQSSWPDAPLVDRTWGNGTHAGDVRENGEVDHDLNVQANGINGFGGPNGQVNGVNGHSAEASINNAVSGESDSFSDHQVETLSVIVRKHDGQPQHLHLPPSVSRTYSNGSIDSSSAVPEEPAHDNQGNESEESSRNSLLYWVKGKDRPVDCLPHDSTYESYTHLRSKALEQRRLSAFGSCPYDMDVLYQFWSHFLIRNFNTSMYEEFRQFAFVDFVQQKSGVGLDNLIKYYGESLSSQNLVRERVAQDYVDMVRTEPEHRRPAFEQLRFALRSGALHAKNRKRINEFIDPELKALLE